MNLLISYAKTKNNIKKHGVLMSIPPIQPAQVPKSANENSRQQPKRPKTSLADVLKEPGFVPNPERDREYEKYTGETVSQVQGSPSFCQKFVELFEQDPNAYPDLKASLASLPNKTSRNNLLILIAKTVGHIFPFRGFFPIEGKLCGFQGFSETFVIPEVLRRWNEFATSGFVSQKTSEFVANVLQSAIWHDNCSEQKLKNTLDNINDPSFRSPILVGSGWVWHSTYVIFYKDPKDSENEIRMAYCNRGADCDEGGLCGICFYKIMDKSKITLEFLKILANRIEVDHSEYKSLKKIKEELKPKTIGWVGMKTQKSGSCTRANLEAALNALLLIKELGPDLDTYLDAQLTDEIEQKQETALTIYKKFSSYEANQTLKELQDFSLSNEMLPIPLDYAQTIAVYMTHLKSKKTDPTVLESLRCSIKACPVLDKAEEHVNKCRQEHEAIFALWGEISGQLSRLSSSEEPIELPQLESPNKIRAWMRSNNALLSKITRLSLNHAKTEVLPEEIQYCTQLQHLDLSGSTLKAISDLQLPNLKTLNINCCSELTSVSNLRLPQLQTLSLSENPKLTSISNLQLPQLQSLDLSNNHLTSFPADLQLPQLQDLNLKNNQLTTFPANLQLPKLEILVLRYNRLTALPEDLQLPRLQNLDLTNNKLTSLPTSFQLPQLKKFYLCDNQFTSIPDLHLPELQTLDIGYNQLTSVPNMEHMPKIMDLMLVSNAITHAPDVQMMSNLRILNLSRNLLTHFPDATLPKMVYLGLTGNRFTRAPKVQTAAGPVSL
jgi:Leucine-rich repeat (LRR) protein